MQREIEYKGHLMIVEKIVRAGKTYLFSRIINQITTEYIYMDERPQKIIQWKKTIGYMKGVVDRELADRD
jgi:hypothetical protein